MVYIYDIGPTVRWDHGNLADGSQRSDGWAGRVDSDQEAAMVDLLRGLGIFELEMA